MTSIRNVDRFKAKDYLRRAEECRDAMSTCFQKGEFNACTILAVHAGIAAADALCVHVKGVRHAGQRHEDALTLFLDIDRQNQEIQRNAKHLLSLLQIKNDAEYGERLMGGADTETCMKHAERLLSYVKSRIERG